MLKQEKGITLIALVITIIILLILAGVTISMVLGQDGIIGRAEQAVIQTELAEIEERAQMIYSDKVLQTVNNNINTKVETSQVIEQLKSEGNTIKRRAVQEGDIIEIRLDKEDMVIGKNKTVEIKVIYEGAEEPFIYYVKVRGKYYKMNSNKGLITINREASTLTETDFEAEGEESTSTLNIINIPENIITAKLKEGSNNIIEITSTEIEGETTIRVTYGSLSTNTCKIKVIEPVLATKITLDKTNGTVTGGLSYTEDLQLKAILEPANVTEKEVTWKSSNPEIATVDSNGLVMAGSKGGNVTITATTKDGTNLEAKCEVITELFGAVNDSTREYTDTEAKKTIKIPGGYAVGTSENVSRIENGFVIQDNSGNQFVWVPVDDPTEMFEVVNGQNVGILYNFSGISSTKIEYSATDYREPDIVNEYDGKDAINSFYFTQAISNTMTGAQFKTQLQNEFDSMEASVEINKGFYIGRYETGNLRETTVVSKRNNIDLGSQNWYVLYQKSKTLANGENVTSSLIWGCQWDATLRWFQKSKDEIVRKFPTDSTGKGNYVVTQNGEDKVIPTGSNNDYMVNNIYDMGGNVYDRTLEADSTFRRVERRGKAWYRAN